MWACNVALYVTKLVLKTLFFELNVILMLAFNFIVLLFFHVICMFLIQNVSYLVATHGHAS